jgi:hypothetical protein
MGFEVWFQPLVELYVQTMLAGVPTVLPIGRAQQKVIPKLSGPKWVAIPGSKSAEEALKTVV